MQNRILSYLHDYVLYSISEKLRSRFRVTVASYTPTLKLLLKETRHRL